VRHVEPEADSRRISTGRRRARALKPVSAAGAVAAALLLLTACGASLGAASSKPASASGSAAGSALTVMTISTEGTAGGNHPEVQAAAEAAVLAINNAGGLKGHQVKDVFCNDQFTSQGAAACAREAVADHVLAVAGSFSVYDDNVNPILQQAGIANIGNTPVQTSDFSSPISFPIQSGAIDDYQGDIFAMAQAGVSKIGVALLDLPTVTAVNATLPAAFAAAKTPAGAQAKDVGSVSIPVTASDFTPYAEALQKDGATGILVVLAPQQVEGLAKAMVSIGYKATLAGAANDYDYGDTQILGQIGETVIGTASEPPPSGSAPGAAKFRADMAAAAKAGVAGANLLSYSALESWTGVEALQTVVDGMTTPINAPDLLVALKNVKGLTMSGGLLPEPWTTEDSSRPAATARIAENYEYITYLQPKGDWQLSTAKALDLPALLSGS
jgi:ABC-type branched-subunit amino acid transport system substrate-binding protein